MSRSFYILLFFFFFNDTATTEIYTLSLHDALPISPGLVAAPDWAAAAGVDVAAAVAGAWAAAGATVVGADCTGAAAGGTATGALPQAVANNTAKISSARRIVGTACLLHRNET